MVLVKNILFYLSLMIAIASDASAQQAENRQFLISLYESDNFLHETSGPVYLTNCLVVQPDGHSRLELFRQELFGGGGVLRYYEANLKPEELDSLKQLIQQNSFHNLRPFSEPNTPMVASETLYFTAETLDGQTVRKVGYLQWEGSGPTNSEIDKAGWRDSAVELRPLLIWFRSVKDDGHIWRQLRHAKSICHSIN